MKMKILFDLHFIYFDSDDILEESKRLIQGELIS